MSLPSSELPDPSLETQKIPDLWPGDKPIQNASVADVVIPIMGVLGKRMFIQKVASLPRSYEFNPSLEAFPVPHPRDASRRIVIISTPHSNATLAQEMEEYIQQCIDRILRLLAKSYNNHNILARVIYLYDEPQAHLIEDSRLQRNFSTKVEIHFRSMTTLVTKWNRLQRLWDTRQLRPRVTQEISSTANKLRIDLASPANEACEGQINFSPILQDTGAPLSVHQSKTQQFKVKRSFTWDLVFSILEARPIAVLLLGSSGVGKSTFINTTLAKDVATVGHDLDTCTKLVQPYRTDWPGRHFVFIDTPGFNDTWAGDMKILEQIIAWLERPQNKRMVFAGIIYLHDITQTRIVPLHGSVFMSPTKLCEPPAVENLIVTTVNWGQVRLEVGQSRQAELPETWKELLSRGCQMERYEDSSESAWAIISKLLEKDYIRDFHGEFVRVLQTFRQKQRMGLLSLLFRGRRRVS